MDGRQAVCVFNGIGWPGSRTYRRNRGTPNLLATRWHGFRNLLSSLYLPTIVSHWKRKFPAMSKAASVHRSNSYRMLAILAFLGSAGLMTLTAQIPKEVGDPKAKIVKKIGVDDGDAKSTAKRVNIDDDPLLRPQGPETFTNVPPDVRLGELDHAARVANTKALREIISKYVVPFDRVTEGSSQINVTPIPIRRSEWGGAESVPLAPLDSDGRAKDKRFFKVSDLKKIEHFETIVLEEVDKL